MFFHITKGPNKDTLKMLCENKTSVRILLRDEKEQRITVDCIIDSIQEILPNLVMLSGRWKQGSDPFNQERTYEACYSPLSHDGTFDLRETQKKI